jgi:hypothetical protein
MIGPHTFWRLAVSTLPEGSEPRKQIDAYTYWTQVVVGILILFAAAPSSAFCS